MHLPWVVALLALETPLVCLHLHLSTVSLTGDTCLLQPSIDPGMMWSSTSWSLSRSCLSTLCCLWQSSTLHWSNTIDPKGMALAFCRLSPCSTQLHFIAWASPSSNLASSHAPHYHVCTPTVTRYDPRHAWLWLIAHACNICNLCEEWCLRGKYSSQEDKVERSDGWGQQGLDRRDWKTQHHQRNADV